jgi:hypothetical protein
MSRIAAVSLRHQALFTVIVACVAALALRPGNAFAAEMGPAYSPDVYCNSIANTIEVYPRFGAGNSYNRQWLSYRAWAKDVTTNTTFWLSAGGQWHQPYLHTRVGEPYYEPVWGWNPGMETTLAPIGSFSWPLSGPAVAGHGRQYQVFIQYAWWSTNSVPNRWLTSGGIAAALYGNTSNTRPYGPVEMAVCYL